MLSCPLSERLGVECLLSPLLGRDKTLDTNYYLASGGLGKVLHADLPSQNGGASDL